MKTKQKHWTTRIAWMSLVAVLAVGITTFADADMDAQEGFDPFVVVAQVLGVTDEALDELLEDGSSLAEVARAKGIAPNALVDAIQQADSLEIEAAIAAGEVSAEEAEEWRDLGYVFAVEFVYLPIEEVLWDVVDDWDDLEAFENWDDFESYEDMDDFGDWDEMDPFEESMFGLLPFGMAIESQRSMAYSLLDNGVKPEAVVDAVLEAETNLLEEILSFILGIFDFDSWFADDEAYWEDDLLVVVAQELAIDEDAIWDALEEGKTIAELVAEAGLELEPVTAKLLAADEAMIAELLESGEINASEAAEWRAESQEMIHEFVHESWF